MPAVRVYPLYGFLGAPFPWGFGFSTGIDVLGEKLKKLGVAVRATKGWTEWTQHVDDIKAQPAKTRIVLIGHSMGANATTWIAQALPAREIALIGAFDCEYKSAPPVPLGANVKKAVCFYGTNWWNPIGHGQLKAGAGFTGALQNIPTNLTHADIDDDAGMHGVIVAAVKSLL